MTRIFSRITGTGSALPDRVVSNDELARDLATRGVETSDEWIVARTGIRQRYVAEPGLTSAGLGTRAAQAALEFAGRRSEEIDLIVPTSTPDQIFPSTRLPDPGAVECGRLAGPLTHRRSAAVSSWPRRGRCRSDPPRTGAHS
jgi:hypothetical protein